MLFYMFRRILVHVTSPWWHSFSSSVKTEPQAVAHQHLLLRSIIINPST